ncbi:leucine-rich repeat domain-containing protein [Bizionia argentinensis JUB59]|uniref:Leucine-rich repeat domain-containing protein n=1 Tax=Bizionia argentinensis JUB59 TaxID=1046627 RepID=G2EFR1_9FLAO|nr:leucine-rich repeat domain-containing protein [Bizionia argentinensis]EGV42725.1 leucine-rich repeat domain-containing protein [Bizionia argentinensis JUB59]
MKHHFGDFLDRTGNYWIIIPNVERYAYSANEEIINKEDVRILTISKNDNNWNQVFNCPNIEEITLHEPSKEQVQKISKLTQITRLRITHLRTKDIEFIGELINLEEIVLEYVSGFSDLSPLRNLKKLKSLHFENLRKVSSFENLKGIESLKYLHIDGTLDWNQPIENFEFLEGLPNLEVFSLGFIINKTEFPAFLPILKLNNLKKIIIGRATLNTQEYAFLETALPNVECGTKGGIWELCWEYNEYFEFLGKRAGRVKCTNPKANEKCEEFIKKYEGIKKESEQIIKTTVGNTVYN